MPLLKQTAKAIGWPCAAVGALSDVHLLGLLAAVVWGRKRRTPEPYAALRVLVVVPAHNEETQIIETLRSIEASSYPAENRRIVVVADNCTDRTAPVVRAAGIDVWEREEPDRRGKGYALEWAFSRVLEDPSVQAVCVIDADCEVSSNLLAALAARLRAGAEAVQAPYLISNPNASPSAALRWAGFALFNVVRPLGRQRLGLSSGLLGTGMAFSRSLLLRSPWRAFSHAEDREQHLRWVLDGARVDFAPEAQIRSAAPTTATGAQAQMRRWDSGRESLATGLTPRVVGRGLRTRDLTALEAALEPVLPPQSVLLGINLAALAAGRIAGARMLARVGASAVLAQVAYVAGGLAAVNAPRSVWQALLTAPRFVLHRLAGLARSLASGGPSGWERTPRETEPSEAAAKTTPPDVEPTGSDLARLPV
ncbi:MAG TPA: glycosyltransferase family 2 protein [Solirubrobacteraceae bacterium]|nr:glycosyltransferase family 2 protein [Solirubrobacteraceae bacterium]